jgi:hypothetical protein
MAKLHHRFSVDRDVVPHLGGERGDMLMKRTALLTIAILAVAGIVVIGVYVASTPQSVIIIPAGTVIHFTGPGLSASPSYEFNLTRTGRLLGTWTADGGVFPLISNRSCACQRMPGNFTKEGSFGVTLSAGTYLLSFWVESYPTNVTARQAIEIVYT